MEIILTRKKVILGIIAGAIFCADALAVSAGDYFLEVGGGVVTGGGSYALGFYLLGKAAPPHNSNEDVITALGTVLTAGAPLAMAGGVFFVGERVDGPSANKWTALLAPAGVVYLELVAGAVIGLAIAGAADGESLAV